MYSQLTADKINLSQAEKVRYGQFTHCYLFADYVVLHSIDYLKEAYALWFTIESPHLPEVKRIDSDWYVMPRYAPLSVKHKVAYSQYQAFLSLESEYSTLLYGRWPHYKHHNYNEFSQFAGIVSEKHQPRIR